MVVSTVAFTLVDYIFKVEVDARIPDEQLGTFFAIFYASLNAVALFVRNGKACFCRLTLASR